MQSLERLSIRRFLPLLATPLLACGVEAPTHADVAGVPSYAKPPSQSSVVDSRAILTWNDNLSIRSDGLGSYGPGTNTVESRIFYYDAAGNQGGQVNFDPDAGRSGTTRRLRFVFPSGEVSTGPIVQFLGLMQLGSATRDSIIEAKYPGSNLAAAYESMSALQPDYPNFPKQHADFRFKQTGLANCAELSYALVRMTRTQGSFVGTANGMGKWVFENAAGAWVVESVETLHNGQPGHWATCLTTVKNKTTATGTYDMPFSVTIEEVR